MKATYLRRATPVAVALVLLAILAFFPATVPTEDDSGVPPVSGATAVPGAGGIPAAIERPIGGLFGGIEAKQLFPATGTRIRSVALFLGTYKRENHGTLRVTLQVNAAGTWRDLATRTVNETEIKDDAYHTIAFSPALAVPKGETVQILVTADGSDKDAVTWWVNGNWQPEGYALFYNGMRQEGTARFLVVYAAESGRLFQVVGPIWRRLTIFLGPLWQAVLIFGFCVVAGGLLLLGRHLTE